MNIFINRILDKLPVHTHTKDVIAKELNNIKRGQLPLLQDPINDYFLTGSKKHLERLIFNIYFRISNQVPQHIRLFSIHRKELQLFWPYETHRSLFQYNNPKRDSLRSQLDRGKLDVLKNIEYKRHCWMMPTSCTTPKQDIEGFEFKVPGSFDKLRLQESERNELLDLIFRQSTFIARNPVLLSGKKRQNPIVEIPMSPMGEDLSEARIKNLFNKKTLNVLYDLRDEFPAICDENEQLLLSIINHGDTNRNLRRLYQRACFRSYTFDPKTKDFKLSQLCKIL
ncbi:HBR021Wp [Eremothecium sinecaudum]|uniref:Genetic interactor of prohibitin 5, mitochondrial n=1 Tax=Eremothecium sinecaudum TaxID=45286 RepID=A0A109UXF8_9SACH|nr:HBR021Wp [Eremothecium sinecaudum]AMD18922.1 HBR021Wp [Eremothecium sinecaudum]